MRKDSELMEYLQDLGNPDSGTPKLSVKELYGDPSQFWKALPIYILGGAAAIGTVAGVYYLAYELVFKSRITELVTLLR